MPTLNWIGKEAVVKHHKEVPFRLLEPVPELSCEKVGAGGTAPFDSPLLGIHEGRGIMLRFKVLRLKPLWPVEDICIIFRPGRGRVIG